MVLHRSDCCDGGPIPSHLSSFEALKEENKLSVLGNFPGWFVARRDRWGDNVDGVLSEGKPPSTFSRACTVFRGSKFYGDYKPIRGAGRAQQLVEATRVHHGRSVGHVLSKSC